MPRPSTVHGLSSAAALSILVAAAPGLAIGPDTTVLVSRPGGFGGLPDDGINSAELFPGRSVSSDGRRIVFIATSDALDPSPADDGGRHCYMRDLLTGVTTLLDRATGADGAVADGDCSEVTISPDGTAAAFSSAASNLTGPDADGALDVFTRDLLSATTTGVSAAAGSAPASGPSIAATGGRGERRIHTAFATTAALDPSDTDERRDAYVHRTATTLFPATLTLVSRGPGAAGAAAGSLTAQAISGDGTRIAFVTGEGLDTGDGSGLDVYVRDTTANTTTWASRPTGTAPSPGANAITASISLDGDVVAFVAGTALLGGSHPDPARPAPNAYVRRLSTNLTVPVSLADGSGTVLADDAVEQVAVNDGGTHVVFSSRAGNLGAGEGAPGELHVYSRRIAGPPATVLVSRADGVAGRRVSTGSRGNAVSITADGGSAVFTATGDEIAPGTGTDTPQVYLRNTTTGTTRLVSRAGADSAPWRQRIGDSGVRFDASVRRVASADGRFVVFSSLSRGLGASGAPQVFRRDMLTGELLMVSEGLGSGGSFDPVVSADGRTVAFATEAATLSPGGTAQIAVWRAGASGPPVLASVNALGIPGDNHSLAPQISADGTRVAFQSRAANLGTPPPANGSAVWLRDLATSQTVLVSRADGPAGVPLNAGGDEPSLSGDGARVAFSTTATNAGNGDTGSDLDIHVRDIAAGRTLWASRPEGPAAVPDGQAFDPSIDGAGRNVAFTSYRTGFTPDDPDDDLDVFVRNIESGQTLLVSRASGIAGAKGTSPSRTPVISADGRRVAFVSRSPNLVADDLNAAEDVFIRDLDTSTTSGVSRVTGANGTLLGVADDTALGASPDLGCMVFASRASALDPAGYRSPDFAQVYLRSVGATCAATAPPAAPAGPSNVPASARLSGVTLRPVRFRAGTARGRGARLRFTLSAAARVTVAVQRPRPGRITGGTCRAGAPSGRRCMRWVRVAGFALRSGIGPTNRRFTAVFGRRALPPGPYRLRVSVAGATARHVTFRVIGAPR